MKTFKQYVLSESPWLLDYYHKDHFDNGEANYMKSEIRGDVHVSSTKDHDIYMGINPHNMEASYTAVHRRTGLPHLRVQGQMTKQGLNISNLVSHEKNTLKAHDFYHHLLTNHVVPGLVSDNQQSLGGKKVWHKLSQMPRVKMGATGGDHKYNDWNFHSHYTDEENDWDRAQKRLTAKLDD